MTHRSSSSCHMIQISINKLRMISPTGVGCQFTPPSLPPLPAPLIRHLTQLYIVYIVYFVHLPPMTPFKIGFNHLANNYEK